MMSGPCRRVSAGACQSPGRPYVWERFWPAAWPVVAVILLFLILGLSDILPLLPVWLHAIVLAGFLGGLGVTAWRAWQVFDWPDRAAALRRMELASGLKHHPLSALDDRLAVETHDAFGWAIWQEYRRRVAASIGEIKIGMPQTDLVGARSESVQSRTDPAAADRDGFTRGAMRGVISAMP